MVAIPLNTFLLTPTTTAAAAGAAARRLRWRKEEHHNGPHAKMDLAKAKVYILFINFPNICWNH